MKAKDKGRRKEWRSLEGYGVKGVRAREEVIWAQDAGGNGFACRWSSRRIRIGRLEKV